MREAPERIWLQLGAGDFGSHTWCDTPQDWADENGDGEPKYIRADLVEAAVKRALEGAANCLLMFSEPGVTLDYSLKDEIEAIRSLASDPAEVTAIIKKAGEDRG